MTPPPTAPRCAFTVGMAFLSAVAGCLTMRFCVATTFGLCVGAAYMPPAETPRCCLLPVCMTFAPHCRAGSAPAGAFRSATGLQGPALSAEIKTPPYRGGETGNQPGTPRDRSPLPGGMYASPTNQGAAYASQKRCHEANRHGPHACGPYKPTGKKMFTK